ncbi:MAG: hypothetical protein MI922_13390 [Bacteroidales bacterium]|nr:hypothetical protein [Bacteroidales bacterium]
MRRFLIFLLMLSVLVISCKRIKNTGGVTNSAEEEPQLGFGTEEQMEEVFIRFPSPDEMLSIFEKEGFVSKIR